MTKEEVALILDEIATLMELRGENKFKCLAFQKGARAIQQLSGDLEEVVNAGRLGDIPGIGATLQGTITQIVNTGTVQVYEELKAAIPPGVIQMLRLPGIGPKKVKAMQEAGFTTIDDLKKGCESGQIAKLKGFGDKTAAKILEGITFINEVGNRVRIDLALPVASELIEAVRAMPGVIRAELAGSIRRRRDTAKDIDIIASSADAAPIMEAFVALPIVKQIVAQGETKSSIVVQKLVNGERVIMNADLRVVEDKHYPFALVYFTGSKDTNIKMRQRAIDRGLRLNEYELAGDGKAVKCKDEAAVFNALELDWIPPEMREDTGEIELAATRKGMPKLIEVKDIRGVFHNHTTASDGANSLEEMALAAKALGLEYFGVGDHSQSLTVANGLTPERVRQQWKEIDQLNAKLKGIRILKGTEVDILADGRLDFDDDLLAQFEYVVASVHSLFQMPEPEMTARIVRAISHPHVTMLGHATGRLLLRRDGYKVNLDRVLDAAAKHGKMIEINAQPMRLDLDWVYCKRAKTLGVPLVINPDAHHTSELALYPFGVDVARRAWLEAGDVFNTKPLKDVLKALKK